LATTKREATFATTEPVTTITVPSITWLYTQNVGLASSRATDVAACSAPSISSHRL